MYEIEKGFMLIELSNLVFKNENNEEVTYSKGSYGFMKNGKFVAEYCKSAGGSSLPLAYGRKTAEILIQSGFVKDELTYCEPAKQYLLKGGN